MMPHSSRSLSDADAESLTALIKFKVNRFVASSKSLSGQSQDLIQQVFVRVLEQIGRFDPARGSLATFVSRIIDGVLIDQSRRMTAQKRNPNRGTRNAARTNQPHHGWSSPDQIPSDPDEQRCQQLRDLELDLAEAIEQLPPHLRTLADALKFRTVSELAEEESVHPGTIYRRLKAIRQRWDDGTLRDYLDP